MNVKLDYHSGQSYSEFFSNYKISVSVGSTQRNASALHSRNWATAAPTFRSHTEGESQADSTRYVGGGGGD